MTDPVIIGFIGMALLFFLLALGMPVGFGMALVGFVGFAYLVSVVGATTKLGFVPFNAVSSYQLTVIPLFVLMAHICFSSGFTRDLYDLAFKWLGPFPGGLAMATIGACAIFAAISASSITTAVTLGLVALPEMKKYKYDIKLATGSVAAGGTLGSLIPPSGGLILYGIMTEESIGKLFMAGIIPGVLEAVFYFILITILCRMNPGLGPRGPRSSWKEKLVPIGKCGEVVVLISFVLGGLFIGWFTPTEAGAVGVFGAIAISLLRRRLTWQSFKQSCIDTAKTTGMIYALVIGAFLLNFFLAVSTIPNVLSEFVSTLPLPPLGIMSLVCLVYVVLGCFVDALAMILLTIPIFFPLVMNLGFHPIWFGVIVVRMGEIGVITPPVGMNVYALSGIAKDVPMQTIFKGVIPFVMADICHVALLLFFPQLTLFLPGLMK